MNAVIRNKNGTIFFFEDGKLHNNNGPAVIYTDGTKEWWNQGRRDNSKGYAILSNQKSVIIRNGKVSVEIINNYYEKSLITDAEKYIPLFTRIVEELKAIEYQYLRESYADFDETDTVKLYWRGIQHSTTPAEIKRSGTKVYYMYGLKHRDNGPAVDDKFTNSKYWYQYGLLHREDGPARIMPNSHHIRRVSVSWFRYGVTHRMEGPAHLEWHKVVKKHVYKAWYKNGKFHRSICDSQPEGPALEIVYMDYSDQFEEETYKVWFEEGKCTRMNGPAIEGIYNKWYINDVEYEEDDYNKIIKNVSKASYNFKKPLRRRLEQLIYEASDTLLSRKAVCKDVAKLIASYL